MSDSTFIVKRYNLTKRDYVDSKNKPFSTKFPKYLGDPSEPLKDGSAPFLSLPTELRLQIYGYLTNEEVIGTEEFNRAFDVPSDPQTPFAYLYRSPGRLTKPRAISKQVISLFQICRRMRAELIDACFSDRTFVLEASIYQRDAGGLYKLPANPGPTAWIKRLVLFTVVEGNGMVKGIGDLRPLQQMTNLKTLRIGFRIVNTKRLRNEKHGKLNALDRPDNVLKAILECIPKDTEVYFDVNAILPRFYEVDFVKSDYYTDLSKLDEDDEYNRKVFLADLAHANGQRGRLSGSIANHALCEYHSCVEGLSCINFHCRIPFKQSIEADAAALAWKRDIEEKVRNGSFDWRRDVQKRIDELAAQYKEAHKMQAVSAEVEEPRAVKKCPHGNARCQSCEKGVIRKLKCWSGQVYRYRTETE